MKVSKEWLDDYVRRHPKQYPADGLAQSSELERSPAPESLATPAVEAARKVRRLVRITSFRVREIDTDNLFIKDMLDALKDAGAIFDDSPKWCKVEVTQARVDKQNERTIIQIEDLP